MNQDMPPNFPPLTLPVVRALTVIQQELGSEKLMAALDVLFEEFFVNHAPTHEPAELARVLAGCLGGEAEAKRVMEATTTDAIKQAVQAKTKAAFDDGAFGLPWIVCTKTDGTTEGFWGVDHLAMVADFLGLEKPAEGWKALL